MHKLTRPLQRLCQFLLPNYCLLCSQKFSDELLCSDCQCELPYLISHACCQQCGLKLATESNFCGQCLNNPPRFELARIPFAYEFPLNTIIHRFKYNRNLACGKLLGRLLAEHFSDVSLSDDWIAPDIIIPTPMHWLKRWQRGFNQTEVLGSYLAESLKIPFTTGMITRTRKAPPQKELTRKQRQQNLRGAFTITPQNATRLQGKRIALLDDVVTTTATMRELSRMLIDAGASHVEVWALARTL